MIQIKDWMSKKVITCSESDTVSKAVAKMISKDIGSLIIVNAKKEPVGILTEKDIIVKVVGRDYVPSLTKVSQVMAKKIVSVDINSSFVELSQKMKDYHIRRVLVTKNGKMKGIVTSRDIIKLMSGY